MIQGSPELMAYVGEECCLGAIHLCQGLGSLALLRVGRRAGSCGRDGSRQQIVESPISIVERKPGTHASYQDRCGIGTAGQSYGKKDGLIGGFRIWAALESSKSTLQIVDLIPLILRNDLSQLPYPCIFSIESNQGRRN